MRVKEPARQSPGHPTVLLLGDGELDGGTVTVKHMATGEQESWPLGEVASRLEWHIQLEDTCSGAFWSRRTNPGTAPR